MPYVENNYALFRCPAQTAAPGTMDGTSATATRHLCSYVFIRPKPQTAAEWGAGVFGTCNADGTVAAMSRNVADIYAPANTIITPEIDNAGLKAAYSAETWFYGTVVELVWIDLMNFGEYAVEGWPHNGNPTMGFADGHAKAVSKDLPCTNYFNGYCQELADMYTFRTDNIRF